MNIGKRLKIAREAIGYTLQKAAEESGIGESSISEFENAKREPKFSHLSRLAEVYRRTIDFFLADNLPPQEFMLWREEPDADQEKKKVEAEFRQLCEQYHRLELCTGQVPRATLPISDVTKPEDFGYRQADLLAQKAQKEFSLGDVPSASLKRVLEERYCVKIFHLDFRGSAISIRSPVFGPAVLLNKANKEWRRNFDLAHELFHLLTWDIFRKGDTPTGEPSDLEEKLANAFASRLLLPTDSVKERIETAMSGQGSISFEALDEIAREFGVSLDALLWRMLYLYRKSADDVQKYVEKAKEVKLKRPPRLSDQPDDLPERYCTLARKTLRDGKLSLMQFAKYMGISYKKAQEYLAEDEDFTDEKISISVA
jgi:Zn-dependent peptidase ImmA (M78 family)/DNA-binding XRE family transcriptional regulator